MKLNLEKAADNKNYKQYGIWAQSNIAQPLSFIVTRPERCIQK